MTPAGVHNQKHVQEKSFEISNDTFIVFQLLPSPGRETL